MSQFIEMFGIAESTKPLADFIEASFPGEWGQEDKDGSGVKVIRTTNFTNNGKLDLSDVVTRDIDSAKIEKKKLFKGDIILERSGGTNDNPVGRVVYFEEDGVYLFNNFTQLLRCKEGVNSLFISYSLFNYYQMNKNVIRSMGNKTTGIQNLKMDRYWQIPIADISTERQKEFESIFRQADKSGFDGRKSQFIEMFGDPMVNDKQWSEYSCISEITQIVLGSTPNSKEPSYWDGDIRWITPAEMTDQSYYIFDTVRHITDEGRKASNLTVLPEGTVLFSTRAPIGKVAIVGKEMCCNQGFKNFICSEKLNNVFLYYTLKLKKDYLCSLGTGTTFKELSKRTVESLKIAVPPIELQNQFETIYNQADKSGFELRKSIDAIDAVIKSLINS